MSGLIKDSKRLEMMMSTEVPDVYEHIIVKHRMDVLFFTARWFLPLYTDIGNWDTTMRIWDLFWAEGKTAIFRIALALLKAGSKELLALTTIDDIMLFLLVRTKL